MLKMFKSIKTELGDVDVELDFEKNLVTIVEGKDVITVDVNTFYTIVGLIKSWEDKKIK